ncbi:MAG TPA: hypothetical protein ENF27_03310 [Chloroflexi bacterium]|nr:MAG: hypothetical protein DRI65_00390 [Chloroflexota bacterium]HDN04944.1 hypothetical protein [Chloroflexota bacterium]
MKKDTSRMIWGSILVLAGILFFLQGFQILGSAFEYLWVILLAAGSGAFLWIYFSKHDQWWAVIPGLSFLGLAVVGLENIFQIFPNGNWTGAVFLGCIGLAFWLVYFRKRQWWAIIPGGVLMTLALVAGLDFLSNWSDVIFFLGMGVTFGLVGLLPNQTYHTHWAFIPAGIMIALGLALFAPFRSVINFAWPVLLVGLGIFILLRNWK